MLLRHVTPTTFVSTNTTAPHRSPSNIITQRLIWIIVWVCARGSFCASSLQMTVLPEEESERCQCFWRIWNHKPILENDYVAYTSVFLRNPPCHNRFSFTFVHHILARLTVYTYLHISHYTTIIPTMLIYTICSIYIVSIIDVSY